MAASTMVFDLAVSAAATTEERWAAAEPARRLLRTAGAKDAVRRVAHTALTDARRAAAMVRGAATAGTCGGHVGGVSVCALRFITHHSWRKSTAVYAQWSSWWQTS